MMGIEIVYKCDDGADFPTLEEAEKHQKMYELFDKALDKYGYYGDIKIESAADLDEFLKWIAKQS